MNHTLKQLLEQQSRDFQASFAATRLECRTDQERSEYDRATEDFLMAQRKSQKVCDEPMRRDAPGRKRQEILHVK